MEIKEVEYRNHTNREHLKYKLEKRPNYLAYTDHELRL